MEVDFMSFIRHNNDLKWKLNYNSGDNSFDDHNEESTEVENTSTETSPVMFFFILFVVLYTVSNLYCH